MRLPRSMRGSLPAGMVPATRAPVRYDRLQDLAGVRENPGGLRARYYVPAELQEPAALVIVLHGCTQDAAQYDQGSGWSRLADRHGFVLLFPEQTRANNPNLCFRWFSPNHNQRGMGEPASIQAMVDELCRQQEIDRGRIFVTGLSAGGAMASVMLATYPELFSAGAIVAGLPYGCASGVGEAFECMGGRAHAETAELLASVRRASPHKGPWPRVSVWHGSADHVVNSSNADAIVRQWTALHGVEQVPPKRDLVEGYPRRVWTGPAGSELVEEYEITGMGHGTPLMPGHAEGESGEAMAHMLDVGVSSTDRIASFFGIAPVPEQRQRIRSPSAEARAAPVSSAGPGKAIHDALRAAGLMQ